MVKIVILRLNHQLFIHIDKFYINLCVIIQNVLYEMDSTEVLRNLLLATDATTKQKSYLFAHNPS